MFSCQNIERFTEKECTPRCHSRQHAELILKSAVKGSPAEIRSFTNWLCYNFTAVVDAYGRNLLHIAVSCGKWEVVDWLLNHCHCEVDVRDAESGWTALHRSFFYGQLTAARILLNQGANIKMLDHEGLTPLDLIIEDRLPYIEYNKTYPQEVYVWGSNVNYNLGLGNQQSRAYPENLEFFNKCQLNIKQVIMCKYHTVFLTSDGKLFTCGHGHGGRLGQGSEIIGLTPSSVRGLGSSLCLQIAAGQDHLLLLMEGNQIWTCGLNTYHQLGHTPPPENLAIPKPISLKFLKDKQIVGVCAARFHSVFYTKDSVYTFGLNAGQLGHPKGDRTQIIPRQVSGIYHKDWLVTEVAASDGATVCATDQGDVYVLHEYQHRKIASKQIGIQKLSVIGGYLDSSCDAAGIREGGGLELRVMLLMKSGKLYLWRQTNPYLRRCLFTCIRQLPISDVYLNHFSVAIITEKNQCYMGTILPFKGKNTTVGSTSPQSIGKPQSLNCFIDRDECYNIRIKRLPYVHRATVITSDSKGRNFAILQALPKMGLLELPTVSESKLQSDMLKFLEETFIDDTFHDVVIKVGQMQYAAHKYVLMSRSEYFKKLLMNSTNVSTKETKLTIDNVKSDSFEQILKFLYCNTCDFLIEGKEIKLAENLFEVENVTTKNKINEKEKQKQSKSKKNKSKTKNSSNPLKCLQETSQKFNLHMLTKMLEYVAIENGRIKFKYSYDLPKLRFNRQILNELCDVILCSEDNIEFPCHKCILAARSDYFHSMLGSCWIEETRLQSLTLPISSRILDILLHYFYFDDDSRISGITDAEFLCHILAVADQLLLTHLKEMCEITLVNLLTLKNACDMLQLAAIYNAEQLRKSCMEYVCINLPAIVEMNNLEVLSDDVIEELSRVYRIMIPSMRRRVLTPSLGDPTREFLKEVEKLFPVEHDCDIIKPKTESYKVENKNKRKRISLQKLDSKEQNQENRKESESSEKNLPDIEILEKDNDYKTNVTPQKNKKKLANLFINKRENQKEILCLSLNNFPALEQQMGVLQKSNISHTEFKKVAHVSQKQKKRMAIANNSHSQLSLEKNDVRSPPPSCPWGSTVEDSNSPSFWDAFEKGLLRSPSNTSISEHLPVGPTSPVYTQKSVPALITLDAIQKAEEEEQQFKMATAKIKPLHLINVEDQAIEELLELYKAKDNPIEKITVSRILPERIADPVWKKRA